jgi:hypothetical protein
LLTHDSRMSETKIKKELTNCIATSNKAKKMMRLCCRHSLRQI